MENFVVSARKYRPSSFATVVGQSALVTTLQNAIKSKHLSHAYLFTGPRGVGKTTSARLLAKTINCMNLGDSIEACNECESCVSFNENRSYNIRELDAASNNSVEDIRNLTDQVRVAPQLGEYSVFIIDEVHMLSNAAFNAFLKTLEEPPKHAIFILATTEKHKIPATILSRCQIYDFKRISVSDIVNNLEYIAKQEGVNYESRALGVIASKSDGGMRDALSIFDQAVSFTDNNLSYENIIRVLGILDFNVYVKTLNYIHTADYIYSLNILNQIIDEGFDPMMFLTGLTEHIRNTLVAKEPATVKLLDADEERTQIYIESSAKYDPMFLIECMDLINEFDVNYKHSANKRLHVELAILKLCKLAQKKKITDPKPSNTDTQEQLVTQPINSPVQTQPTQSKPQPVATQTTENVKATQSSHTKKQVTASSVRSIKASLKPIKEEKIVEEKISDQAFDQSDLEKNWQNLVLFFKESDPYISNVLDSTKPKIIENFHIQIPLRVEMQKSKMMQKYDVILRQLKILLNNTKVTIELVINAAETKEIKEENTIFTSEQKYNYLKKKNPEIEFLKEELGLDIL